jgi:hypothetical protein
VLNKKWSPYFLSRSLKSGGKIVGSIKKDVQIRGVSIPIGETYRKAFRERIEKNQMQ